MRFPFYFRFTGLLYDMPFIHQMCPFVKNFFSRSADEEQKLLQGGLPYR